ncbi:hypothetical protein LTR70_001229 [Exophiala xenobiotica]|uniref:Uncharacterized protein n=1 Tax=Lithohypha guttulata TaxID=1690604 RepID=A0ABR0KKG0_9EURO|nr:hypothetical protein LTR24_001480 [Lithohypha guttulata]KAK5328204.1 hypothetical protein LTR70_001229 [Exophiala xenobiotica]
MKRPSVHDIVFSRQFPKLKQGDPQNFYTHVQRNLVPEVRLEVQTFYGALDSLEAQYPGLDYTYEPHRRRLARFKWHERLFHIFDQLRLTPDEILSICQWEGTKSAKDKYQAETKRTIRDTTMDDIMVAPRTQPKVTVHVKPVFMRQPSAETMAGIGAMDEQLPEAEHSEDEDLENSVGVQLNEQLMAEGSSPVQGPLEEWLKYMHEREADRESLLQAIRAGHPPPTVLERIRASATAAAGSSEAVTAASSHVLPSLLSATSTPERTQSYGPTNDEILATLESRVQG